MKRTRIYLVAAAMVLGLATVLAGAMPASAHNGRSRQTNVAKFALEALLNVTKSEKCLGVGSHVGTYYCTYVDDQSWHFGGEIDNSGFYQLVNDEGQCLGIAGGSIDQGADVNSNRCIGTSAQDQYWTLEYTGPNTYECWVFNYKSGYVLDIRNGSTANGAQVQQWHWIQKDINQDWIRVNPSHKHHRN